MAEMSNQKQTEEKKYPPTIDMHKAGDRVVAMAVQVRTGIRTKYGTRDVMDVVTPDAEDTVKAIFWPRGLPMAPLCVPFYLERMAEGKDTWYRLVIPDTDAEKAALWAGKLPESAAPAKGADPAAALAQAVIRKFKS